MRTPMPRFTRRSAAVAIATVGLLASACSMSASPYSTAVATEPSTVVTTGVSAPTKDEPAGTKAGHATRSKRPNIVMIMADDMRVDDLRFAPNIRRLIGGRGVTFANSFSPYPLCCPARASFLTGLYAHNHGVLSHVSPYGFGSFDDSFTVATALHRGGYNTGFVGKYLNEYGAAPSLVTGENSWTYVPAGWTDWEGAIQRAPGSPARGGTYNYFNTSFNVNGTVENGHRGQYQTNVLGRKARRLVTDYAASRKPFFLYFSSVAPHFGQPYETGDPRHVPNGHGGHSNFATPARPDWVKGRFNAEVRRSPGLPKDGGLSEADVKDKPRYVRKRPDLSRQERRAEVNLTRQRAEAVYVLDLQVKKLVHRLKRTGELRNTILMFTSDNGYLLGEHRIRTGKTKPYEPSLRVPFMIAGPGIPQGRTRYDPIMTFDITATITDLANVATRMARHHAPDGTSKLRVIRHGDRGWTVPVVTEALLGGVPGTDQARVAGFLGGLNSIGIRTARYKYVRYTTGETELYDLAEDANELHSVDGNPRYRRVERRLAAAWRQYKNCAARECRQPLVRRLRVGPAKERHLARVQDRQMNRRYGVLPR